MYRTTTGLVLGLAAATISAPAYAAGWAQPPGDYYIKVWNRTLVGSNVFTDAGEQASLPETYQDHQLNVYAEYGLTERLTLTLSASPFGFASYDTDSQTYFGGASAGARYQLYRGPWVAAVSAQVGGRPSSGSPLAVEFVEGETLVIKPVEGSVFGSAALEAGYGFSFGWVSADAGARFFSNSDLNPALFVNAQLGFTFGPGFVIDLHAGWYNSFGDFRPINVLGAGQTRYVGVGIGASWWFIDSMAVTVGFDGAPFAVANAATPALTVGLEFR